MEEKSTLYGVTLNQNSRFSSSEYPEKFMQILEMPNVDIATGISENHSLVEFTDCP